MPLYLSKKYIRMIAWPLYVPFRYCGIIYMCAHCTCVLSCVHHPQLLFWQKQIFAKAMCSLAAQMPHCTACGVLLSSLYGRRRCNSIIWLHVYLCWAKCQWSLNEVQDSAPDQQMLYNLKCPGASTAVFTEQEWAELSVVGMYVVCICATVLIVYYEVYKLAWVCTGRVTFATGYVVQGCKDMVMRPH